MYEAFTLLLSVHLQGVLDTQQLAFPSSRWYTKYSSLVVRQSDLTYFHVIDESPR